MKIKANKTLNNEVEDKTTFFYYAFRNILLVSLPLLVISAFILSLPRSSATASSTDNVTFSLDVSCTISSNVLDPHTLILSGSGLYRENIGTTKVGVFCNDNNGYNIYAIGHSNNIDGNTDLVASNTSTDYNIETGVYSSGDTVSSWGMKLTAGTGTGAGGEAVTPPIINNGYDNYNVVPSSYTLVASRPSGTNMNKDANIDVTGSYFTTTYDIYASSVQPADTYTGKVKYILTHPNTNAPNTINDIDAAFALAGKQKVYQDANGSYYAMQDMSHDICNSVTRTGAETTTQLVDIRDNNLYYVTKLKDGNCWMTQNLDLELRGTSTAALTSENTDLSTTASGSGIYNAAGGYTQNDGIWTWAPSDSAVTSNHIIDGTSVPNWSNQNALPYSAEGGDVYYYTSNGAGGDTTFSSLQACKDANHTEADCKHYHRGNYYNWTAAIASNDSTDISTNYDQAVNSICPKGWRLPIAINSDNATIEFGQLLADYKIIPEAISSGSVYTNNGFINVRKSPLWFVRSGYIDSSTLQEPDTGGYYWSSIVKDSSHSYDMRFNASGIWPANTFGYYNFYNRNLGRSIRCLAR